MAKSTEEQHVRAAFESAANRASMTHGMQMEEILGTAVPYRDFMQRNLSGAGPVSPDTFARWMESADRGVSDLPDRGVELMEMFDEILIRAVREGYMQPPEVVSVLDEWVEDSKQEAIEMHGLPADFFDTEVA